MANDPKASCQAGCKMSNGQNFGLYMPKGEGKTKGLFGKKGNLWSCMGCGKLHVFDKNGHFLGFGE